MHYTIIKFICVFFSGILAGEEFIVRYGLSGPLAAMDDKSHIQLRQLLIRRLRIVVPVIFLATFFSAVASLIFNDSSTGFTLRGAGLAILITWIVITLTGTAPINKGALEWQPDAPPANWQALINRWKRLDTWRAWLAILAFVLFLAALHV